MTSNRWLKTLTAVLLAGLLCGCFGDGADDLASVGDSGILILGLTDATSDQYKAVYITIDEVLAHIDEGDDGSWVTVIRPESTHNLLELVNGFIEQLGFTDLEPGTYTQLRLYLGESPDDSKNILDQDHPYANYIIDKDDIIHELQVPSGYQSGVKLVHEFDIVQGVTVELVLDFDALNSVVKAGASGRFLLKPVIRVIDTIDNAHIIGKASDTGSIPVERVKIAAQADDPALDPAERVTVYTSTVTNETGDYAMYLSPEDYNLVAYKQGYRPECHRITAVLDGEHEIDFMLSVVNTGIIEGAVTLAGGADDDSATLSFRQTGHCAEDREIEVESVHVAQGGDYSLALPAGQYSIVAYSEGRKTLTAEQTIVSGETGIFDVNFP